MFCTFTCKDRQSKIHSLCKMLSLREQTFFFSVPPLHMKLLNQSFVYDGLNIYPLENTEHIINGKYYIYSPPFIVYCSISAVHFSVFLQLTLYHKRVFCVISNSQKPIFIAYIYQYMHVCSTVNMIPLICISSDILAREQYRNEYLD